MKSARFVAGQTIRVRAHMFVGRSALEPFRGLTGTVTGVSKAGSMVYAQWSDGTSGGMFWRLVEVVQ